MRTLRQLVTVLVAITGSFALNFALAETPQLEFTKVSSRSGVVDIANAGDGSGRLFLVQQSGRIYILDDGEEPATPFLDLASIITSAGNEQGLLSMAFAPDYITSGYFYVWYTAKSGSTVLARYRVSDDPNVADALSGVVVLNQIQPAGNHNGGRLRFGPDGMLYLGLGDGGGGFDPDGNGQNGSVLLGKVIRIDVDPSHGTYAIPASNPFVSNGAVRDEIWAAGVRNPWRISFDSMTGDLFIADVGQNKWEEVNFQPASSGGGENYGWSTMEGTDCVTGGCDQTGLVLPVAQYGHATDDCSITGGEVYRGNAYPNMHGMYFYGDYCSGRVWGLVRDGGEWVSTNLADTTHNIATFGLGEDGSLYMASTISGIFLLSDGEVVPEAFRITAGLNDAWYNPATDGQGVLTAVFEDAGILFLAWFTYDTERPPDDVMAILGEPGHRWLTAQGPFEGDTATLDIYLTAGGVFDSFDPAPGPAVKTGTLTVKWLDCNSAIVTYQMDTPPLMGQFPIERIVLDNVALCEALQ